LPPRPPKLILATSKRGAPAKEAKKAEAGGGA
jgi:hypothetical protein